MLLTKITLRSAISRNTILSSAFSSSPESPAAITLYQYAICPFCHKAKALLAYASMAHNVVEVNPLTKSELKHLSGNYRKVPIATIEDEQVNGSNEICRALLARNDVAKALESRWVSGEEVNAIDSEAPMSMEEFQSGASAERWSSFAHDDLAALLYPNICPSLGDSYEAFGYVKDVDSFSPAQKIAIRGIGSLAMYFAASKVLKKRGISDGREALQSCLSKWEEEGLENGEKKFASGKSKPNMGDLAVFGTLHSIKGLSAHAEVVEGRGGAILDWYTRMDQEVYGKKQIN
eukprot:CAMPEP_0183307362 /NCGR_PEP_ID=MMETSP0160_2-20130417/17287_1 /TAXON_ID=2839 ORGANISM="Odontella Sinensis, Strain Grunow 1884" /NCGR_SAMPLE_ID=MMETSP0160_2 /ASSEMBLY_ACC=CAM_ASM_000250 /LENGTH=290 /DNA_ID=CAMNT_0025470933 /DNA_START=20 /DNA_END=889 /DNA_ORIENTATION=+